MSRRTLLACLCSSAVTFCLAGPPACADDEGPLLKKAAFKQPELDDLALAQVLKIRKFAGTYELSARPSSVGLRLECYREGKKIDLDERGKGVSTGIGGPKPVLPTSGEFLLQVVDLDHLKLSDGKEKHWRISLWIRLKSAPEGVTNSAGRLPFDVPKATLPALTSQGGFPAGAGGRKEAPLFWIASGKAEKAATVKALVEKNKNSTILVCYLTFTVP